MRGRGGPVVRLHDPDVARDIDRDRTSARSSVSD